MFTSVFFFFFFWEGGRFQTLEIRAGVYGLVSESCQSFTPHCLSPGSI